MLGISQTRDDLTRCRYCGEKLSLLQRLSRAEYCNPQHRDAFQRDQEQLAIGRLQQVVAEGREAEVFARLGRERVAGPTSAGDWPEPLEAEAAVIPAVTPTVTPVATHVVAPAAPHRPPVSAAPVETGPALCGPMYGSERLATGAVRPAMPGGQTMEISPSLGRIPATPADGAPLRVPSARGVELGFTVPAATGERRGRESEWRDEMPARGPMRFPALSIQSVDWNEAIERERRSWAGIPPLAGLIQIAGPQTLRFETRLHTPMPLPEHPSGNPVRAYKPGLARGTGMPGLAGAIRGLGTWRTRFGSEGRMLPQWEAELLEGSLAPDWKPRFPVFYTTKPWDGAGLEDVFGLGPGSGPGVLAEGDDEEVEPREVEGPLAYNQMGPDLGMEGTGGGTGAGVWEQAVAGTESGGEAGLEAATAQAPAAAGDTSVEPAYDNQTYENIEAAGQPAASGMVEPPPAGIGFGSGYAAGGGGKGPGTGVSGSSNGELTGLGGEGRGGGVVSLDAVAALVKAARQSDRSRTPLRDIDVRLMTFQSSPQLARGRKWRGMREGSARDLPERGPMWVKVPYEVPAVSGAAGCQGEPAESIVAPAPECLRPAFSVAADTSRPELALAPKCPWNEHWLSPVTGSQALSPVEVSDCDVTPALAIPVHVPAALTTGGASHLQTETRLPEPWVHSHPAPVNLAPAELDALPPQPVMPQPPVRSGGGPQDLPRKLEMGTLERPGSRWVLLRGSAEAATFRLALDHLHHSEPGPSAHAAEWGPVASHVSAASPATAHLAVSSGFVHRELILQSNAAEPSLEPLVCQFGSARGGQWDSRK